MQASGNCQGFPVDAQLTAAYRRLRAVQRKVRRQREYLHHKLSAWLVGRFEHIITEQLSVASMRADETKGPALKRGVADAAWASFLAKLQSKADEAGSKFAEVPTSQVKPTRHGFTLERDRNACRNTMRWSFEGRWRGKYVVNGP
jgi:putative transposase